MPAFCDRWRPETESSHAKHSLELVTVILIRMHSIAGLLLRWPHDCLSCVWACAVCSRLQLHFVISNYLSVCGLCVVVCYKYMDGKVSLIGRTNFSMLCFEKLRLTHLLKEKAKSLFFLLFFGLPINLICYCAGSFTGHSFFIIFTCQKAKLHTTWSTNTLSPLYATKLLCLFFSSFSP